MTSDNISKSFSSGTVNSKGISDSDHTGFKIRQRPDAIRNSNIVAAKGDQE